jgi:DNA-binding response OmpR family regulator
VPIILMTGFGWDPSHSIVKARQEGLQTVLYKPFRADRLMEAVELSLRSHPPAPKPPEPSAVATTPAEAAPPTNLSPDQDGTPSQDSIPSQDSTPGEDPSPRPDSPPSEASVHEP